MAVRLSALRAGLPLPPPRKIPGTHFCYRLSRPQGHSAAGRIRSIEKFNDLIGNRTRALPARNTVPHPTTLPRDTIIGCRGHETHSGNGKYITKFLLGNLKVKDHLAEQGVGRIAGMLKSL
jgi:hypothetical protein